MPLKFVPNDQTLNNPEYLPIDIVPDNEGGHRLSKVTHYTFIPGNDGWDKVVYYRFIGSNNDSQSPRNGVGGFVYVLTNDVYKNICKIGMTTNSPDKRLKQINNAGVVEDWQLSYYIRTGRPYDFEQSIHLKLADIRNRADREFFNISVQEAIRVIKEMSPLFP